MDGPALRSDQSPRPCGTAGTEAGPRDLREGGRGSTLRRHRPRDPRRDPARQRGAHPRLGCVGGLREHPLRGLRRGRPHRRNDRGCQPPRRSRAAAERPVDRLRSPGPGDGPLPRAAGRAPGAGRQEVRPSEHPRHRPQLESRRHRPRSRAGHPGYPRLRSHSRPGRQVQPVGPEALRSSGQPSVGCLRPFREGAAAATRSRVSAPAPRPRPDHRPDRSLRRRQRCAPPPLARGRRPGRPRREEIPAAVGHAGDRRLSAV